MSVKLSGKVLIHGIEKPISALALGTAFFTLADKAQWFDLLDRFLALGGTVIDSGRVYGDSEAVLGEWLAARRVREQVVLITKGGHGGSAAILPADNTEQALTEDLLTSLRTLGTDYIDLYLLHRDNPAVPVGLVMEWLNRELEHGRVHAVGASNWEYGRVDAANAYATQHGIQGFAVVSNNLSLAVPTGPFYPRLVSVDRAGERWHSRTGIPLVSWSSQARGFFTGRYAAEVRAQADSITDPYTRRMIEVYCTAANFERLRRASELGVQKGAYSAVQVALAWLLHKPFPLLPVVGPHNGTELESCVNALAIPLNEAECRWLNLES